MKNKKTKWTCPVGKQSLYHSARSTRGQVMLLTTLILSGTILAAATLAGLLMVYQIRQSGDATQSTKAIYAADAGIEYELYKIYRYARSGGAVCSEALPELTHSKAEIDSEAFREANANGGQDLKITSTGISNDRARAFGLNLGAVTITTCFDPPPAPPPASP